MCLGQAACHCSLAGAPRREKGTSAERRGLLRSISNAGEGIGPHAPDHPGFSSVIAGKEATLNLSTIAIRMRGRALPIGSFAASGETYFILAPDNG